MVLFYMNNLAGQSRFFRILYHEMCPLFLTQRHRRHSVSLCLRPLCEKIFHAIRVDWDLLLVEYSGVISRSVENSFDFQHRRRRPDTPIYGNLFIRNMWTSPNSAGSLAIVPFSEMCSNFASTNSGVSGVGVSVNTRA